MSQGPDLSCLTVDYAESPLVVAIVLRWWWRCFLDIRLLRVVLLHEATHPGIYLWNAFFQLQFLGLCGVRLIDWHGRVLDGICVRAAYIRVGPSKSQGRPPPANSFSGRSKLIRGLLALSV